MNVIAPHAFRLLLLAVGLFGWSASLSAYSPQHVVFTWQGDTGTTITINYQTLGNRKVPTVVHYDTQPRDGRIAGYRHRATGDSFQIAGVEDRWIHRVELTDLTPGATLWLLAGDFTLGTSREFKVRTIPHDDRPLRFVVGGDMDANHDTREMLREAAKLSPDFALIGGDLAYADGLTSNLGLWDSWFSYWCDEMVTPEGYSVPVVVAIGNHEVRGGYGGSVDVAPFYFAFFAQHPEPRSFFAHQFGANLVVLTLDTGHVEPHDGRQTEWLDATLSKYSHIRYRVAQYHVPLYPSNRSYEGHWSALGRQHWLPLFDRHELTVGFENHDHTYKRSHRLRNNQVVAEGGTLYLGDGSWGRQARPITKGGRWYLHQAAQVLHFWLVELDREEIVYRAIDHRGRTIDVYPPTAAGADEAASLLGTLRSRYILPAGVVSGRMRDETQPSASFPSLVTLHNPFDAPMTVAMAYHSGPRDAQAVGLPAQLRLAPGERQEFPFTLNLREPQQPDETRYWVSTIVEVDQPEGPADAYEGTITIQTRARALRASP